MLAFADGMEIVKKSAMGTSWGTDADTFCDKGDILIIKNTLQGTQTYRVVFLVHLMVMVFLGSRFRTHSGYMIKPYLSV